MTKDMDCKHEFLQQRIKFGQVVQCHKCLQWFVKASQLLTKDVVIGTNLTSNTSCFYIIKPKEGV
jgi:hypothetical protein